MDINLAYPVVLLCIRIYLMEFTDKQIEEFINLYFKRHGRKLSKEDALEQATKLIRLLLIIYQPMASEETTAIQEYRLKNLPKIIKHIASQGNNESV
jgi:hypothetical protein